MKDTGHLDLPAPGRLVVASDSAARQAGSGRPTQGLGYVLSTGR